MTNAVKGFSSPFLLLPLLRLQLKVYLTLPHEEHQHKNSYLWVSQEHACHIHMPDIQQ